MLKSKLLPEDKNKVGCYIIQDKDTMATYVGSGVLGDRYYKHRLALERGRLNEDICTCDNVRSKCKCRHFNPNLQKVYNNNPDQLELLHMVIDDSDLTRVENRANASQMEQLIIDKLEGNPLLLNIAKDTTAPRFGVVVTEDIKLKQSIAQQQRYKNRTDEEKNLCSAKAIISNYSKQGINISLDEAFQRLEENKAREIENNLRKIEKENQRIEKDKKRLEENKAKEIENNLRKIEKENQRIEKTKEEEEYKNSTEYKEYISKIRSDITKKQWEDPEYRKTMTEVITKKWEDPAFKQRMSKVVKKKWEDPNFKQHMGKLASERIKKQWEDPDFRKTRSDAVKKQWEDPEIRNKFNSSIVKRL